MNSVLIVDDEIFAIRGVISSIDWEKLSVDDISTAHSMGQAQKVFADKSIDVMLCDIEMPNGSGLDLLWWVHEKHPDTVTLFLTCHSDFDYAKKALELGAAGYLLKPVPFDELQTALMKAIEKRHQIKENITNMEYRSIWNYNKNIVEERFWLDILTGDFFKDKEEIISNAKKKNIVLHNNSLFTPILLRITDFDLFLQDWNRKDLSYALHNIIIEVFSVSDNQVFLVSFKDDSYIVLIQADGTVNHDCVAAACRHLCELFSSYLQQEIMCFIGNPTELDYLFHANQELLNYADLVPSHRINVYKLDEIAAYDQSRNDFDVDMSNWAILLSEGKTEAVINYAVNCLDELYKSKKLNRHIIKSFYHNITQMVYIVLLRNNILAHKLFNDLELETLNKKADCSINDCKKFIFRIIEVADEAINALSQSQNIIERVKQYIDNNLQSELTREQISRYVYLNQDYLSRLFKRQEKTSISDYICERRINYAKRLLIYSNESISLIGEKAGYSYNSHFSKTFKKKTGMTPASYRKLHKV